MKTKLLLLLVAALMLAGIALSQPILSGLLNAKPVVAGGGACTTVHAQNVAVKSESIPINDADNTFYQGLYGWNPGANISVCKITAYLSWGALDIETNNYYCEIYVYDGGFALTTAQGTSNAVLGTNTWSATAVDFTFASPVAVTSGTSYAIIIRTTGPASKYAMWDTSANGGFATGQMRWGSSKAYSGYDVNIMPRLIVYK
jgi:hypothetical protein